jgi:probable F420-dependent oxidoreductase
VRAFAEAAEDLGYDYLIYYDHVLGADTRHHSDWSGPYSHVDPFHEPFVTFGYLAAVTKRIELVTAVVILPQRQTALVAKQAAQVDILSGGRLRLGIGIGWNDVEYEALGENFHDRGKRSEEQIELLRALWTKDSVDFHGQWHDVTWAGLRPLPIQRPIPIWFGGGRTDRVLRRIASLGDGWMPQLAPDEQGKETLERFRGFVAEAGRDLADVGIDARVGLRDGFETALEGYAAWRDLGATHVAVNSLRGGIAGVDNHIDAIRRFKEAIG